MKKGWTNKTFMMSKTLDFHKTLSLMSYSPPGKGLKDPFSRDKKEPKRKVD